MVELIKALFTQAVGQAVLATLMILGTFVLLLTDREVPVWLVGLDSAVVGFYFSQVVAKTSNGAK